MPTYASLETAFASAERADRESVQNARAAFVSNRVAVSLLEAIPEYALVLNEHRQIVAANSRMLQALGEDIDVLLGARAGEVLRCENLEESPNGCGTGRRCASCLVVQTILESLTTQSPVARETQMFTLHGTLDLLVQATFVTVEQCAFIVVAMRDMSAENRRQVLERVFFHDVLNTIGGVYGLAEYLLEDGLEPATERECKRNIHRLSRLVIEDIVTHRQLLAAERGALRASMSEVEIPTLLFDVVALYRHHRVAQARTLRLGNVTEGTIVTDEQLLRRVLANLVKNARKLPRNWAR